MTPLAERLRPQSLSQLKGQQHLTDVGSILRNALDTGKIPSMILWGPPGVGKTTIANIIAQTLNVPFYTLSAISSGVKEVREVIEKAKGQERVILFIDEIHRFNKGQQDALLGAVEKGIITLIGATTENPSFEVNSALLSRCQVYVLKPLDQEAMVGLISDAIKNDEHLSKLNVVVKESEGLINLSGGDARKLLNLLELVVNLNEKNNSGKEGLIITNEMVIAAAQRKTVLYDKKGEQHYDIISAFIKSMRGSDPNAAIYWLARMIEGGEEVKFIARRMVIFASEDIGNANPTALVLANNTFQAVNVIGYPESSIILSQCAAYLAASAKSNASYMAIKKAQSLVMQHGDLPVPLSIRNAPTKLMKEMDYGKEYQYAHNYEGNFADMEFLPEKIKGTTIYNPGKNAREEEIRKFLKARWKNKYGY
ncbi:MAG: replication-associated recombination protein A [Bacteroidetes bacterium]|nr:replication-associated recombination protein A [Bacteroidota bacterium]